MARRNPNFNLALNKFFIDAIKFNVLLETTDVDKSKAVSKILKEFKLDCNLQSRFDVVTKNGLVAGVNLKYYKSNQEKIFIEDQDLVKKAKEIVYKKFETTKNIIDVDYKEVKEKLVKYLEEKGDIESMKKVMAIDLGNNNVKVAVNGQTFSFVNKISREDRKEALADNEYIRMNDDLNYYIISNIDSKFEKSSSKKDKNFIPTLNYSIVKALAEVEEEIPEEIELDIALLTPINQSSEKEEYIEKIKQADENIVECNINGKEYFIKIKINNVVPMLEGCSSFFLINNLKGINTLIDIGSRTINIVKCVNNKFQSVETLDDLGSFNYYQSLVNKVNDRDITIDNIQDLIDAGIVNNDKQLLADYLKKVLEETNKIVKFKTNNKVYFSGGTMKLLKDNGINFIKGNLEMMENPVFSNVLGALKMMEVKFNG